MKEIKNDIFLMFVRFEREYEDDKEEDQQQNLKNQDPFFCQIKDEDYIEFQVEQCEDRFEIFRSFGTFNRKWVMKVNFNSKKVRLLRIMLKDAINCIVSL